MKIDNDQDYETLHENEQYLYDLCKRVYEKVSHNGEPIPSFVLLVGEKLARELKMAVAEGPDPRMPT